MKVTDLSVEDQALLQTSFPAEIEKQAAADVEKMNELYATGFDKLASEIADEHDKEEAAEKDEKKELDEEHKKEAAARGAFIARGTIDGLMKIGSERHNDEFHYLYPALSEKLGGASFDKLKGLANAAKAKMSAGAGKAKELANKGKATASAAADKAKAHATKHKGAYGAGAAAGAGGLAGYFAGKASKKD